MMSKGKKYWILTVACLMAISSCEEKFLDVVPDNRVALDDLDKAAQLLVNAYSIATPNFGDWMSDDVDYTVGTTKELEHDQMFEWQDVTAEPTELDTPIFFWYQTYAAIAHANEVLAVLDDLPATTDEEVAYKRSIESEALLARAYGHFMLVNFFGRHYEDGDNTSLGIPYILTPETTFLAQYERETVARVYDLVEEDMLRGIELLDDTFFANSGKYHFNRNAALAFAARFYLFKGEFSESKRFCDMVLGSNPGAFIRDLGSEQFQLASSSVVEYPQLYSSPDLAANFLLMRKISIFNFPNFAFGIDQDFYGDLFDLNPFPGLQDERENPAFVKGFNGVVPARYQALFQRSSLNSNVGTPYFIQMSFTGEEVLLTRAECNIYLNNLNDVLDDMQIFSENRFSGGEVILTIENIRAFFGGFNTSDRLAMLNYVLFERRKEFLLQGMRWFDIKRYQLEVDHVLLDGSTITLESDDLRKALQIPQSAVDVGGLEDNPR